MARSNHPEYLNTPRLVADANQQTVWKWDQQEPFGNNPADENPGGLGAFDLPLRLPGQRYDAETALHYNYFRDYDPSLGIYKQSDPIGLLGGINTYTYGGSSPLSRIDPTGELFFLPAIIAAISSGSSATTAAALGGAALVAGGLIYSQNAANSRPPRDPIVGEIPTGRLDFPANEACKPDRNDCPKMKAILDAERAAIKRNLDRGLRVAMSVRIFNEKVRDHNQFCPAHQVEPL